MVNQINAILELPVVIMITVLFSACILKSEKSQRLKWLITIIAFNIASYICDIPLQLNIGDTSKSTNLKLLWAGSYFIMYCIMILFHYFILSDIRAKTDIPHLLYFLPVGMVTLLAILYFTSYRTGMFFSINDNGEYIIGQFNYERILVVISLLLIDILITLIYSGKLGFKKTLLLLTYEVLPIAVSFIDDKYHLSLINLCISILILVDFAVVSVKQDIELAKQKQYLAEKEKSLLAEQTKIMISQIQPHFLYNVISSIMVCCKNDPGKAVEALSDFSDYLRCNMHSITSEKPMPFKAELEHIKTYVRLEKLRFEERLEIKYDIEDDTFLIPTLTIQPLVENAIKHGISQKPEGGTVTVSVKREDIGYVITVTDDGAGFDTEKFFGSLNKSDHIGISNVRSRIWAMCKGTLVINSEIGKGTVATVFIPFEKQSEQRNEL